MFQSRRRRPMYSQPYHQPPQAMHQPYPAHSQMNGYPSPHQHPQMMYPHSQQMGYRPKKLSIIKSAFIGENGSFDVGRTVKTVDQVMKTVNQVSPIVKQVSSFFKK